MKIQFEAGEGRRFQGGVNYMISDDGSVYAECPVPEGASEDYGYLTMKAAITAAGVQADFWYDGQEDALAQDASADCEVYAEIGEGNQMKWYAVQINREDDWGKGSYNLDEAIAMAKKQKEYYPDTLIAVIENDTCIEEITDF